MALTFAIGLAMGNQIGHEQERRAIENFTMDHPAPAGWDRRITMNNFPPDDWGNTTINCICRFKNRSGLGEAE